MKHLFILSNNKNLTRGWLFFFILTASGCMPTVWQEGLSKISQEIAGKIVADAHPTVHDFMQNH